MTLTGSGFDAFSLAYWNGMPKPTTLVSTTEVALSGVTATDDIRFEAIPSGTRIDYTADIRLRGLLRLVTPFAGGAFARIARDARDGMQRTLDRRASAD